MSYRRIFSLREFALCLIILANAIGSMALHCLDWTRVNSKRVCKSPKAIRYLGLTSE